MRTRRSGGRAWTVWAACVVAGAACFDSTAPDLLETQEVHCTPEGSSPTFRDLPLRAGPPATTTGTVPHQQIDPDVVPELIADMGERIFARSDVQRRASSIVPGATAIWLREDVTLERPECIVLERELGHIHEDGSLHVTLPHGRIPGAADAGWIERHPWADVRPGFEAYVMIFSPRDSSEVDIAVELVDNGITFVQGK